jgi:ATP-dependent HslUV protease ATP-binding subunit HslU
METEGMSLSFTEDGITRVAEIAYQVNETTENIGARRLHTIMERLLEDISYHASSYQGQTVTIDSNYVDKQLSNFVDNEDLSHYIL